ncbi:MAG: flavin reductase family protein [Acidimicrobiia bacterium]|nr:flavin reductase family protein [Acidimicrobiia bacterium]
MADNVVRSVMGNVAACVTVVTVDDPEHGPVGITVSAFTSVSADPPIVLVCIGKHADSLPAFLEAPGFTVNFLPHGRDEEAMLFATRGADKFGETSYRPSTVEGAGPVLDAAYATFECRTTEALDMGDHWVIFGEVVGGGFADAEAEPLVYLKRAFGRVVLD